jgi:succinate-acetate transporter protein
MTDLVLSKRDTPIQIGDTTANPAPLGLLGFGMTTVLLNIHNAGYFGLGSMILGMGLCYGGVAQVIAGLMEWKKGNTFGTTAFTSYGLFWISLVVLLVLPKMGLAEATSSTGMGAYLGMWGIFTAVLFVATLRMNRALQFVFGTLALLFFLLAAGDFMGNPAITMLAGYEGIICGLAACYAGLAQVLNGIYERTIAPLG